MNLSDFQSAGLLDSGSVRDWLHNREKRVDERRDERREKRWENIFEKVEDGLNERSGFLKDLVCSTALNHCKDARLAPQWAVVLAAGAGLAVGAVAPTILVWVGVIGGVLYVIFR